MKMNDKQCEESIFRFNLAQEAFAFGSWKWDFEQNKIEESFSSEEGFVGSFEDWIKTIDPLDSSLVQSTLKNAKTNRSEAPVAFDYRVKSKNGEVRFINVIAKNFDETKMLGASRDVTREMLALMQKSSLLESSQNELEALSYAISHDLRAPLRGIDGWSAALLEDYGHILDENAKNYLDRVRNETKHMSSLINDLLKIAQIAKTQMKLESLNLSSMAEEISAQFVKENIGRKIQIKITPGIHVQGDDHFMKMALTQLFSNSFKFTSKLDSANIEFGKEIQGSNEVFFIKDNGAGFNSGTAKKLFGTFQRMHRQNEFPGNGVGLSIVKRIITLHHGRIWAESYINNGATFFFTINEKN